MSAVKPARRSVPRIASMNRRRAGLTVEVALIRFAGSDPGFGRDASRLDRGDERRVVALRLIGVGLREAAQCVVERVVVAEIPGDLGRLTGSSMAAGKGPAAELRPGRQVVDRHRVDDGARLLVLQLANVPVPASGTYEGAEQDVGRRLQP